MIGIQYEEDKLFVAIPVKNFPVLPVGEKVHVYFDDQHLLNPATIEGYSANNKHGTEIRLKVSDDPLFALKQSEVISLLCVPTKNEHYSFIYPGVLDFGIRPPFIQQRH